MSEENKKPEFKSDVKIEDTGVWKKKITVVIPREQIEEELESQYSDLRTSAQLPGFRKGRAPKRLIEKRFGGDIKDQAKFRLLAQAFQQVEEDEDFEILGEPDLNPDDIVMPEEGDFTFVYEVEVKPEFELPKLEGIKVEKEAVEITEDKINEAVEMLCKRAGSMQEVDEAQEDDHVMSDIVLNIEGIENPVELTEWPLWVSPCTVKGIRVENMADVIKGVKKGDVKKHSMTISEDHKEADWQNKKVDMEITVQYVKRLKPAELTEEFLKSIGCADENELRRQIEEELEARADQDSRQLMSQQIYDYLDTNIEMEVPENAAAKYADRLVSRRIQEMLQQGVPYAEIEKTIEEIRATSSEQAQKQMKMSFILEKICDELKVEASSAEVNSFIANMAYRYGRRPEKMKEELASQGRLEGIRDAIAEDKAIAKVLEMAEVVDKEPAKKEKAPKKTKKKTTRKKPESAE